MPSKQDDGSLLVLPPQLKEVSNVFSYKEVGKLP